MVVIASNEIAAVFILLLVESTRLVVVVAVVVIIFVVGSFVSINDLLGAEAGCEMMQCERVDFDGRRTNRFVDDVFAHFRPTDSK